MPRPRRTYAAPPLINFMGRVSRLSSYARARRAAPPPPRHFPDARRAPKSTTDHATLEMAIIPFGWEPPCRVRPEPADSSPCHQYPPSAHVGRAPCAVRHVLAGGCQPAKPHPYSCPCPCSSAPGSTAPPPETCGHTPCLRRARPPYATAHTWQAHLQSAAYLTQAADWDSATMVMVIPAGVAGTDGFFLQ